MWLLSINWVIFFHEIPVPKSVLYFTKEASDYQYEESDEEVQEAEGEEEDSDKKPEEGPGPSRGQPGRTQVSLCSSEYHPATIPDIHF